MENLRVLIVVNDVEAGSAYSKALAEIGVMCDIAASFNEMAEIAMDRPINGLLVDILTLVRCSKEEKQVAYECFNIFPILRVKWDKKHRKIALSPLEQTFSPDTGSVLNYFIESRCRAFPARCLRRHKRREVVLNVLVSTDAGFAESTKSFCVNISQGGIYLHFMQELQEGDKIWLRFTEFRDQTPIPATVRWSHPWGISRSIPGVGVSFDSVTDAQQKSINSILNF
ncbi:pilus protein PilZ [Geomonas sp. Red276]